MISMIERLQWNCHTIATITALVSKKAKSKKKKSITAKKMCSRIIQREGVKKDGTLKKGYLYTKAGKIVKVKSNK